jgi:accessory gene regulator protein AgrB
MSASHKNHDESNELSTAQMILLFCIFSFLLVWLGDTFTAVVGIIGEIIIFVFAYNEKHKLID